MCFLICVKESEQQKQAAEKSNSYYRVDACFATIYRVYNILEKMKIRLYSFGVFAYHRRAVAVQHRAAPRQAQRNFLLCVSLLLWKNTRAQSACGGGGKGVLRSHTPFIFSNVGGAGLRRIGLLIFVYNVLCI